MSITSYSDLLTQLGRMVTFEGENPGDASVGVLETLLGIAENRIYRDARTSYNMVAFGPTDTVTGNSYTVPPALKAVASISFGGRPLEPVPPAIIQQELQGGGVPRYFANQANTLIFAPTVADGTQLQGYYYARLPALSEATLPTNALFAAASDLFLYAVMVEAAPMYGFQDQLDLWNARYVGVIQSLNQEQQMTAYSAGRMRRRSVLQRGYGYGGGSGGGIGGGSGGGSGGSPGGPTSDIWDDSLTWDDNAIWTD